MAGKNCCEPGVLALNAELKHAPPLATPVGVLNAPGPPLENAVVPPGISQTAKTSEPVRPTPCGLKTTRSPAVSPLPLESTADCRVIGWPDCARNTEPIWKPLTKVFTNALSLFRLGT